MIAAARKAQAIPLLSVRAARRRAGLFAAALLVAAVLSWLLVTTLLEVAVIAARMQ